MTLQVVQHTSAEYLGLMEDHLEGRSIRFRYCRPFTGGVPLPRAEDIDGGLVLLGGGPWGAGGTRGLPTLAGEVALAKRCLELGKPTVGIGLGAQILAIAAGGEVEPAPLAFRIGNAKRTSAAALQGYVPAEFPFALYMRDRAVPPSAAQVLAVDDEGRPALWQVGPRAVGFAAHPGLKVAMIEDLVMEFEESPAGIEEGLQRLRLVQREIEDALVPLMTGLVGLMGWMRVPD